MCRGCPRVDTMVLLVSHGVSGYALIYAKTPSSRMLG
jgi:hypothetical protein